MSQSASTDVQLPPWSDAPLPHWAQSIQVRKGDAPMRMAPTRQSKRRGSASREARLPLFAARYGSGCREPWLHVGPQAWLCGDDVELSGSKWAPAGWHPLRSTPDGLPFRYFFVSRDGSFAYDTLDRVDIGEPAMSLEPGFAVAVTEQRVVGYQIYGRTNRGLWLPMRDLNAARTFLFHGSDVEAVDGVIPVAWVVVDRARVYRKSGKSFVPTARSIARFEMVAWREQVEVFGRSFARISDDEWLRGHDLRHPTVGALPEGVATDERWLDVELASQTLVAYEGARPVYATIVSTGKGKTRGHPFETPKGLHRVWVKLQTAVMDNLEDEGASNYWRIEDVPYVQYFAKGVGLHAAFWHRSFGHVRSHGCVNLAPIDAQRLFWFTAPHLPSGWTAVLPTEYEKGNLIRVR